MPATVICFHSPRNFTLAGRGASLFGRTRRFGNRLAPFRRPAPSPGAADRPGGVWHDRRAGFSIQRQGYVTTDPAGGLRRYVRTTPSGPRTETVAGVVVGAITAGISVTGEEL